MKNNKVTTLTTLLITLALIAGNISTVFADSGTEDTPEDSTPTEITVQSATNDQEEIVVFQENENTETVDFSSEAPPEEWMIGGSATMTGNDVIDEEGDGWLRLTDKGQYVTGFAVSNEALPTENGLGFMFDLASWGGSGADGITFFLMDGATEMEDFNAGGTGGSLGYAPRHTVDEGLSNAVVGIGLDEFGNYSLASEGRTGGTGRTQNSVSVRGSGDGFEGYEFIEGTEKLETSIDTPNVSVRPDQDGSQYRSVSIVFQPVDTQFSLTMSIVFGANSEPQELFNNLLLPGVIPDTVKFGFTASSGGATNIHEIRNVVVDKAVIEIVQEELEEEDTSKTISNTNKSSNVTITVPVVVTKTDDKLTIIPVTGSDLYDLNCSAESQLDIENQAFTVIPAMCDYKASLTLEHNDTLPAALPQGFGFVNAITVSIVNSDGQVSDNSLDTEIVIGFYLNGSENTENLSILSWESGKWVEKDIIMIDGAITTTSQFSGLFILVEK